MTTNDLLLTHAARTDALYQACLWSARAKIRASESEIKLILDACNGMLITPGLLGQHLRAEVADAIKLNQLDEKWRVDGRALVSRIRELPLPLTAAVELWISEYWGGLDEGPAPYQDADREREHLALMVWSE